jgi:hypothetical protein
VSSHIQPVQRYGCDILIVPFRQLPVNKDKLLFQELFVNIKERPVEIISTRVYFPDTAGCLSGNN